MKLKNGIVAGWLMGALLSAPLVGAAEKTVTKANSKESIRKAMEAEMSGKFSERDKWIDEAMKYRADSQAHWQKGLLKQGGSKWLSIEEAAAKIADSEAIARYEALRGSLVDTPVGHWKLAQSCMAARLSDQAKAHLHRVLELEPDHEKARAALGFQRSDGEWIEPARLVERQKLFKAQIAAVEKHGRMIRELLPMLQSSQIWQQERAIERLATLTEPSAALAVEQLMTPVNDAMAQQAIRVISGINDPVATSALVRHAFHPSQAVRDAAAQQLASRDLHAYAPLLLSQLSMPIRSEVEAIVNAQGQVVGYRQVFERVTMERNEVVAAVTNPVAIKSEGVGAAATTSDRPKRVRSAKEAQEIAMASLSPVSLQRQQQAAEINVRIANRNERIFEILRIATGQELPSDPQAWWNWYESQVGIEVEGRDYRETDQLRQRMVDSGYRRELPMAPRRKECFVAGTLVTTHRGAVAIETVRLGDMVLSKNIETGELAFRPVLQTTVRAPEDLMTIEVGGEAFRCTKGHLFWVSGRGWTKAGDLLKGMVLHGAENPQLIDKVTPGGSEQTFNLKVADNANYFVGTSRLLSHDVSSRGTTEMATPGYKSPRPRTRTNTSVRAPRWGMGGMGMMPPMSGFAGLGSGMMGAAP